MFRFAILLLALGCLSGPLQAQSENSIEIIEVKINPAYSPTELDMLIQLLASSGVTLEFLETGYCNGQLRILNGKITGPDGNSLKFETNALRQLTIQLRAHTKEVGVQGIRMKNRWRKCKPKADEPEEEVAEMRRMHAL